MRGVQTICFGLNEFLGRIPKPDFTGWGMTTYTIPPWNNGDEIAKDFLKANNSLISMVEEGEINLPQFNDRKNITKHLQALMWRHYNIFNYSRYAAKATSSPIKNIVECGVCDGLTAFFTMKALYGKYIFKAFLYDAWEGMKSEFLLESEKVSDYSFLDINITKHNLSAFKDYTFFNKGHIPKSFETSYNPSEIIWLHIDLNSSIPTTAALQFFFDRISPGGVILFDDYARSGDYDTRVAINKFLSEKRGHFSPLPTGQAIYYKIGGKA